MNILQSIKNKILDFESKKNIRDFNISYLIGLFLIGFIGISLIASVVQIIINYPLNELLTETFKNSITDNQFSLITNLLNGIMLFGYYFITFIIFIILIVINQDALKWFISSLNKNGVLEGIAIALMMFCCSMIYSLLARYVFNNNQSNNNQEGLENSFAAIPFLSFFSIVIFAPFCEEITYRMGLFGAIAQKSKILAYFITILFFAFIHFDFQATDIVNEFINIPAYIIGAAFLCYAYERKGNLVTSITAHMFYNGFEYILMLISIFVQ